MSPLLRIFQLIWREERAALGRGLILSVTVLVAGATLLGLSGWFITAAGAAGLAGVGIAFDVFRPSAGVRMLALGRTAARYGERILTHDATLRALARLRIRVLDGLARQDAAALSRLRSPALLNRVTADVDALDGIAIRLIFPLFSGVLTLALAAVLLAWLVAPVVAIWTVGVLVTGAGVAILAFGRASIDPAARAEGARQSLRAAAIEHLRSRTTFAFAGVLPEKRGDVLAIDEAAQRAELDLAALDRRSSAVAAGASVLASGGALVLGGLLAQQGAIAPATAAIAVFAALGLAEVLAPLHRGIAEIGRMRDAAKRLGPAISAEADPETSHPVSLPDPSRGLTLTSLTVAAPGGTRALLPPMDLSVAPGETVALTGRSGLGKSTLFSAIAGLSRPLSGSIKIQGIAIDTLPEAELRMRLGFLQQRSQLVSGTVRDNLQLAAPDAADEEMWHLLDALGLTSALSLRGGLDMRLAEGGAGLSGGETRRVALARVLLRKPQVLLCDEPTEGLDPETSGRVLAAMRQSLPDAAILLTTHRDADIAACDRLLAI